MLRKMTEYSVSRYYGIPTISSRPISIAPLKTSIRFLSVKTLFASGCMIAAAQQQWADEFQKLSGTETQSLEEKAYVRAAMDNLKKVSRTASSGKIDVSSSLDKKTVAYGIAEDTQKIVELNYAAVIRFLYDYRHYEFNSPEELRGFVENVLQQINHKVIQQNSVNQLIRKHDSSTVPYLPASQLNDAMGQFYRSFYLKLKEKNMDPIEMAAWVEYRINLTDHFFTDGCSKASMAISTFVLMRHGHPLPEIMSRSHYFTAAPNKMRTVEDETQDPQFQKWLAFYRALFQSHRPKPLCNI